MRFQSRVMCSLVPLLNSRLLLAIMVIKPVAIGSFRDQTSLLFPSLYRVGPGKTRFNLSSSTFSCTVFLYNVLKSPAIGCQEGSEMFQEEVLVQAVHGRTNEEQDFLLFVFDRL